MKACSIDEDYRYMPLVGLRKKILNASVYGSLCWNIIYDIVQLENNASYGGTGMSRRKKAIKLANKARYNLEAHKYL